MTASPSDALDVVTCGEAMALFAAREPGPLESCSQFERMTAGAELNVAIGLARLGHRVGYLSRVGDDALGRFLLDALERERIDRSHVVIDDAYPTGLMFKTRNDDGSDPQIEYFRRGSAASRLSLADYDASWCLGARHLHLTGISPALSDTARELTLHLAREARAAGKTVSFDPNLRLRLWPSQAEMIDTLHAIAATSDIVLPGLSEGRLLTGRSTPEEIAAFYLDLGAKIVVVKLGDKGAYYSAGSERGFVEAMPVARVVDTVGAGDGFAAGLISGLLDGLPVALATERAVAIGARVIQYVGDCEGLPTREQLEAMRV